jgi:Phage Tail Collar Domain
MKMPESLAPAARRAGRYRHFRTAAEIAGAVLLLSGGAATAALAAPAVTGTTIHGCENTKTGALRVLLKSQTKCPKGTKALSWNTTGPRGPRGPAGTAALFGTKTNVATSGSGGAACTEGEIILTAGTTAASGTMLASGQILQISTNQVLFALLGTKYGGNGTTTFALPNLQKSAPDGLSYSICVAGIFP